MEKISFENRFCQLIGSPVCDDGIPMPIVVFDFCNPAIILSEIKTVYLAKTNTPDFFDWSDRNEWQGRVSETSNEIEALRPITVVGDKPLPQTTIRVISNRRKVATDKVHVINCTIDDVSDNNHGFMVNMRGGRYMKIWYETLGGYMYGGAKGIYAFVQIEMTLARGPGEIATLILIATWNNLTTELRSISPMLNPAACPTVSNLYWLRSTPYTATFSWDDTIFPSYEYAVNTTGTEPDTGDWIATDLHELTLEELTDDEHYYFFVRIVCSESSRGVSTMVEFDTPPFPALNLPPIISKEWNNYGSGAAVTGTPVGTSVFEYSDDDGATWNPMPTVFPVGIDSRLQCTISTTDTGVMFTNIHPIIDGWKFRLSIGVTVSNAATVSITRHGIDLYDYHDRVYAATGAISDTELTAIRRFIKNMDGEADSYDTYPIADTMVAVYPMLGSTATTQKINLVSSSFLLTDNGTVTHDANGFHLTGATTNYVDTGLNPDTELSANDDFHVSIYQRDNTLGFGVGLLGQVGAPGINIDYFSSLHGEANSDGGFIGGPSGQKKGAIILTRNDPAKAALVWDSGDSGGVTLDLSASNSSNILLGYSRFTTTNGGSFAFTTIGNGLTVDEAVSLKNAITAFVTSLGRNV